MKIYRIINNGIHWKVEEYKQIGHLWWKQMRWISVDFYKIKGDYYIDSFNSKSEAEYALESRLRYDRINNIKSTKE